MKRRAKEAMSAAMSLSLSLLLALGVMAPTQLSAQTMQRLFSTPTERAELDRLRFQIATGVQIAEPVDQEQVELPTLVANDDEEVIYALGGTMRKADGSFTVWINNVAYDQTSLPENIELLSPYSRGQLQIRDADSGASFNLKPGQVLNLTTGQLYESYQYQEVLAAAAAEAARVAAEDAANAGQGLDSAILDSAAVEAVTEAAQDL